ncbi:MAG: extracellular matrix/biofilm biosynthesis regulator RemA family protein [bacterium]
MPEGSAMRKKDVLNIGHSNTVLASRIVAILIPGSSPMRRFKEETKKEGRLVDATHGRKCRSLVLTDSGHLFLSSIQVDTLTQRLGAQPAEVSD